jgi:uncharacterized protein YbbC (DUF1343 family)
VRFGIDCLVANPALLDGCSRVGMVTNDAARLAADASVHSRVALQAAGVPLVRLFGPEHGLSGTAADGAAVGDDIDVRTGLPVVSLYGERMRPTREQLHDLDVVLFDIPDVGARFYTYTWTLFHLLSACAEYGVPLVVLDRPNPLGGASASVEGPVLELAYRSFVGEDAIPIVHALTLGELACLWQRERFPAANVRVIACTGWRRGQRWPALSLPWVPTSPSMPAFESVAWYPGTCLFEATNLSVGRGTDAPFCLVGAPWLDAAAVLDAFTRRCDVPASACTFMPSHAPYLHETCQGIRLGAPEHASAPVATGLLLLAAIMTVHAGEFAWRGYPTAANPTGEGHFERLVGRGGVRAALDADAATVTATLVREWTRAEGWRDRMSAPGVRQYSD